MPIATQTYSDILTRLRDRVVARSGMSDLTPGGSVDLLLRACAAELDELHYENGRTPDLFGIATAEGEDLAARAADIDPEDLEPQYAATYAVSEVVLSRSGTSGDLTLPEGHVVRIRGAAEYELTADLTIPDGFSVSSAGAIRALVAGSGGNADVDVIDDWDPFPGLTGVENTIAITGGVDAETADEFRARIRAYQRGRAKGTVQALRGQALGVAVSGYGRVVTSEVDENPENTAALSVLYVDDGLGQTERSSNNSGDPEVVLASATGGEQRFRLAEWPVREGSTLTIRVNAVALTETTDFRITRSTGWVELTTASYPTGLGVADEVTAEYTWYVGLVREVQRRVEGDLDDLETYPGYKAMGTTVVVKPPSVLFIALRMQLTLTPGAVRSTVAAAVKTLVVTYVNGLPINGDLVLAEVIARAMTVAGVYDVQIPDPSINVVVGQGVVLRTRSDLVTID